MRPRPLPGRRWIRIRRKARASTRLASLHVRTLVVYAGNRTRYRAVANPYRVLWIDPDSVENQIQGDGAAQLVPGTVIGGDWDLEVTPFVESSKYRGLVDRFIRGMRWEDTFLFRTALAQRLASQGHLMGMRTTSELVLYYETRIDPLFEDIRVNGFAAPSLFRRIHPVHVSIGRQGGFLCGSGGNHRLAIARLLHLRRIPVRIEARHAEWQDTRETVKRGGATVVPAALRRHPDLLDLIPAPPPAGSPHTGSTATSG